MRSIGIVASVEERKRKTMRKGLLGRFLKIAIAIGGIGGTLMVLLKEMKPYKQQKDEEIENVAPLADSHYRDYTKRLLDCIIAFFVLLVGAIPMGMVALFIKLDSPGPVFFRQERIGKAGKVFNILKFRSMCVNAEKQGSGVYSEKGDPRVTRIGRIIRATSIDELPQMLNVLRGDMSLIGPRPPLTYHPWPIEEYTDEQLRMFEVRPGLTGWAQVHGRKHVEWHKRIELNVWYVDHVTFALDLKIFFMTIFQVIANKDNVSIGATVKSQGK